MRNELSVKSHTSPNLFYTLNSYALAFTLIVLTFLTAMRFITLFLFAETTIIHNNIHVLGDLFWVGLRFDLRIIGIALLLLVYLPYLLLFWIKKRTLLQVWVKLSLSFLLAVIILLAFVDIGYFLFFGTPIDILIFGLFEDDTGAVIKSALTNPYLVLIGILSPLSIGFFVYLFLKLSKSWVNKGMARLIPKKAWFLLLLLPFLLITARGSIGTFPLSLKQSAISGNSFINSLTQNAVFHLNYAYANRKENNLNKSTSKILKETGVESFQALSLKAGFSKTNPLIKHTPGNIFLEKKPPHIVFVLMEGWSSQIALSDSKALPVLGSFRKHAKEDYFLPYFFSNQNGTNPSIESILLNSPLTPLSQSSGYRTRFATSNIKPFKEKGYQTFFLSGGYSSWRNHDIFWPLQGFDQYIDRTMIEKRYKVHADNPWGVYDEFVFRYLEDDLPARTKPSFTFLLTTNNHPPVRLPKSYKPPEFHISKLGFREDQTHKKTALSGYHYQTNALGNFLDWLKSSKLRDDVIVVATGDHPLRGFDDYTPVEKSFFRHAVPVYLYIPKQYNRLATRPKSEINSLIGSHVDIFPSLFELALSDAPYYAFGKSILEKTKQDAYGWNYQNAFILKEGVIDSKTMTLHYWNTRNKNLIDTSSHKLNKQQVRIIEQEKYRRSLKEWLLYKDKEEQEQ